MQPLKVLVVVLGAMIVVGLGVVVVTIVQRLGNHGAAARSFGTASVTLPKDCHVVGMATAGAKLALQLGDGPDCQLILFVDPESGQEAGRIGLLVQP
jgi:hypothetical protein